MAFILLGRIAYRLKNYKKFRLYNFLEKYSFVIYLLHQQIMYCVIDGLNGKISAFGLASMNFFTSLFISSLIIICLRKLQFMKEILKL